MVTMRFTPEAKRKLREMAERDVIAYTETCTFLGKISSSTLNEGHIPGELPEREIDERFFIYVLPPDGPGVYMVIVTDFIDKNDSALVFALLERNKPADSFIDALSEQISAHLGGINER